MTQENKKQIMDTNMDYRFMKKTDAEFKKINDILELNDNRSYLDNVYLLKTSLKDKKTISKIKQNYYENGYHYKLIIVNNVSDVLLVDYSDDIFELINRNIKIIKDNLKKTL